MGEADPLAAVIVPIRDGGAAVPDLITALAAQTVSRDRFEVIIGDDGSTDGAIGELATDDGWIRIASGPPLNSYAARNRAVQSTSAPVLAFCDVDCLPEPTWLEAGLSALQDGDLVGGMIRFVLPERRSVWTLLDVDLFLDQERTVQSGKAVTANLFVRREIFDRINGFDDSLPNTGDYDFVARAVASGARLVFSPEACVLHPTRDGARPLLRKVWAVNRRYATRQTRTGRRPRALKLREWIPLMQTIRSRRRFGRSLRADRRRLKEHGVAPTLWEDLQALALMYLFVPYVANAAQLHGWWEGRRSERDGGE